MTIAAWPEATPRRLAGFVIGAFLAVTGCGSSGPSEEKVSELVVAARLMHFQEPYLSEQLDRFGKERGITVRLVQFQHLDELSELIESRRSETATATLGLVKVHHSVAAPLVKAGALRALEDLEDNDGAGRVLSEFIPEAVELVTFEDRHYGIPRKLEAWTRMYRVSKVADVYLTWEHHKEAIHRALARENGRGLPAEFKLDLSLDAWDSYDQFVAAYVWRQLSYAGVRRGRQGIRRPLEFGTFMDHAARLYQYGANRDDLVARRGPAFRDLLHWEAMYLKHGLYANQVDQEWIWREFYNGIYRGDVFMFTFHPMDQYVLRNRLLAPDLEPIFDLDDLRAALDVTGASLHQDDQGAPVRRGTLRGVRTGWFWGVPTSCRSPRLAFELARVLSGPRVHREECSRFGMLPVRRDVWNDLDAIFLEDWKRELMRTSLAQYALADFPPGREETRGLLARLREAIQKLAKEPSVLDPDRPVDPAMLDALVKKVVE